MLRSSQSVLSAFLFLHGSVNFLSFPDIFSIIFFKQIIKPPRYLKPQSHYFCCLCIQRDFIQVSLNVEAAASSVQLQPMHAPTTTASKTPGYDPPWSIVLGRLLLPWRRPPSRPRRIPLSTGHALPQWQSIVPPLSTRVLHQCDRILGEQ